MAAQFGERASCWDVMECGRSTAAGECVLRWLRVFDCDASARAESIKKHGERTFSSIGGVSDGRPVERINFVFS